MKTLLTLVLAVLIGISFVGSTYAELNQSVQVKHDKKKHDKKKDKKVKK